VSNVFDGNEYRDYIERMKLRTKQLALSAIRIIQRLPREEAAKIIGRQMLRSSTSVGANYRAVCRARTNREFVAKMRIVCEEIDESQYWCELLLDAKLGPPSLLTPFHKESTELTAVFTKALDTARRKLKKRP